MLIVNVSEDDEDVRRTFGFISMGGFTFRFLGTCMSDMSEESGILDGYCSFCDAESDKIRDGPSMFNILT